MDSNETPTTPEAQPAAEAEPAVAAEPTTATAEEQEQEKKVPYEIIEKHPHEGSVVHYKVSVPREELDSRMEEMLKDLKSSVAIEGFRKGKAPRKLLEIRYGKDVKEDSVKTIAGNVSEQIVENEKLALVAEPDLHNWTAEEGQSVELTIEYEIRPEIDVVGYENLEVEVTEQNVTEEMVESRLAQLRESNAQFKSAGEDAKFNPGDAAVVDYEVLDEHGHRLERYTLENQLERDPMARFPKQITDQLVGLAAGQTITAEVESSHQTRQGQQRITKDTHKLTVREIKIKELPELDDDFAKDLGDFNSIGEVRDRIRKDLEARAESIMNDEALTKIQDKILEQNPFDAPRSVVAASTVNMVRQQSQRLAYAGVNLNQLSEDAQRRYVDATRVDAERGVKRDIMLANIARKENIEVTDEDVNQTIDRIAEAEGRRPLAIRARMERENRLDDLKGELLITKVNELLLSKTKINKVAPAPAPEPQPEATTEG